MHNICVFQMLLFNDKIGACFVDFGFWLYRDPFRSFGSVETVNFANNLNYWHNLHWLSLYLPKFQC